MIANQYKLRRTLRRLVGTTVRGVHDSLRPILFRGENALPGVIINGVQKGGTTSLFDYLVQHPEIAESRRKEIHYFTTNFHRGERWYRTFFPADSENGSQSTHVEATPYYLFHPAVPARLQQTVPDARIITVLRDPVKRAISHYWHEYVLGLEPLGIEEAFAAEASRLEGEADRLMLDPKHKSYNHQHFSYFARGCYADQIRRWFEYFPEKNFLFLRSEDLFLDTASTMQRTFEFLGLDPVKNVAQETKNANMYPAKEAPPTVIEQLTERYRGPNAQLDKMIGVSWE